MASPHVAADLLEPTGELTPALFPGLTSQNLTDKLTAYLTDGYDRATAGGLTDAATKDACALAYAYHRAYRAVWIRLSGAPAVATLADQGSRTYTREQLDNFRVVADEYLKKHESYFPVATSEIRENTVAPGAPTSFRW